MRSAAPPEQAAVAPRHAFHGAHHRRETGAHRQWNPVLTVGLHGGPPYVADDYLLAIEQLERRRTELDAALERAMAADPSRIVSQSAWLRCFRGIETLTAMLIVAELHDFRGFARRRGPDGLTGSRAG